MGATTDWVITHDATQGDMAYAMECLRCGDIQRVPVPIQMPLWLAMAEAFTKLHSKCQARERKSQ